MPCWPTPSALPIVLTWYPLSSLPWGIQVIMMVKSHQGIVDIIGSFPEGNFCILMQISLQFVCNSPFNNNSSLVEVMASHLTHWGQVTHICVSKLSIIGSDNGLSPDRRQAIIWTNAEILLIGTLGTNFNEILFKIHTFSFKNIWKWRLENGVHFVSASMC